MGTPVNEHYTAASGTSMATPHASGLAALLLQAKPSLSPSGMKGVLMDTALDLSQDANAQGSGRVQAYHALQVALGQPVPTPEPTPPDEEPTPPEQPEGCLPTFLIPFVGR
jgi:serine protease AprX